MLLCELRAEQDAQTKQEAAAVRALLQMKTMHKDSGCMEDSPPNC